MSLHETQRLVENRRFYIILSDMRLCFLEISITLTLILSPVLTMFAGDASIESADIFEIWMSPTIPSSSWANAP